MINGSSVVTIKAIHFIVYFSQTTRSPSILLRRDKGNSDDTQRHEDREHQIDNIHGEEVESESLRELELLDRNHLLRTHSPLLQ